MKAKRWVIKVKGSPCVVKAHKRKWTAKVHVFFLNLRYCGKWQFSLTYEKTYV
jgi:hypothetical protein